ncbi:MAG: hypothetical protein H8E57_11375 [Candidatus Cloacimonetes bacterium]|nr:hypothetical protein [Candidatus Cloacimonadota bacterium]
MKKCIYSIIVFVLLYLNFNAIELVPRTATIDSLDLHSIRSATALYDHDDLMRHYWCKYINIPDTTRNYDENGEVRETFKTGIYLYHAFWGVIGHDLPTNPPVYPNDKLELANLHLLDPNFPNTHPGHHYLDIADVIEYIDNDSLGTQGILDGYDSLTSAFYTLNNLTYIVDLIWEYAEHGMEQSVYQDSLLTQLDSLASWVFDYLETAMPSGERGNSGMLFLSIMGYAGLVLDNYDYIDFVDERLDDLLDNEFQAGSGIYKEGLHYQALAFIYLSNYFTARKRYENYNELEYGYLNYYNHTGVRKMYENSIYLYCPDLSFTSFDDCYKVWNEGTTLDPSKLNECMRFPNGMYEYYFQQENASDEFKAFIDWYVWERLQSQGYEDYPYIHFNSLSMPSILSYNDENEITPAQTIPSKIKTPNYSNEEFTVLRDTISTSEEFRENLAVWVNHENYDSHNIGHEHGDQTSFTLYYEGRNYKNL